MGSSEEGGSIEWLYISIYTHIYIYIYVYTCIYPRSGDGLRLYNNSPAVPILDRG